MAPMRSAGLVLSVVGLLGVWILAGQESQKAAEGSLTIEEVLRLSKAPVADELIIARVKRNGKAFDLNTDEILVLKNSGVSETVIKYLLDPSLPYSPSPPPPPATGPPPRPVKPSSDPLASKVPPDPGMYYLKPAEEFLQLDLKPIVPYKQPGKVSKLSVGMVKGHIIGSMAGATAKTRAADGAAVFYFRLGDKAAIDDITLLSLQPESNRRQLDFGTKPGKPVFPPKSVHQFESKEVDPGLFRLTAPIESHMEYVFFILGSGDDKKGVLGRGYEFGTDKAQTAR
jgi:hypothetical protein